MARTGWGWAAAAVLACGAALGGCADTGHEAVPLPRPARGQPATLASVTDGDTVRVVLSDGSNVPVRLIGIDAPEVYSGVECGGREASSYLSSLVAPGDPVVLVVDPSQARIDRYDRLLRYVDLPDGTDLGERVIGSGWARPYVYDEPFARLDAYRQAEVRAPPRRCGGR